MLSAPQIRHDESDTHLAEPLLDLSSRCSNSARAKVPVHLHKTLKDEVDEEGGLEVFHDGTPDHREHAALHGDGVRGHGQGRGGGRGRGRGSSPGTREISAVSSYPGRRGADE